MRAKILFLGKTKEKYLAAGIADYLKRLKRYVQVEIKIIKEKNRRGSEKLQIKADGCQLLENLGVKPFIVALDSTGQEISSGNLANLLSKWEQQSRQEVTFIIGGHLGLSEEVKEKADFVLSLSKMTFTHEMARLLLIEQLYRAFSIKAGSKYHK
jgi:23S rRNA (pseudouridine1915-N3)-methyltransferase